MSTLKETYGFCEDCKRRVKVYRKGTNHILHFLISLFTCGMWLIIWLFITLIHLNPSTAGTSNWKCTLCGSHKVALDK